MTPRELLARIRRRSMELLIASGGSIEFEEAERQASLEVAANARYAAKPRDDLARTQARSLGGAKQRLASALNAIASRMTSAVIPASPPVPAMTAKRGERAASPALVRPPASTATPEDPLLIYAGSNLTGGERIPEETFKPHLRDRTTQGWRESIAE